jgi:hypothetical protein
MATMIVIGWQKSTNAVPKRIQNWFQTWSKSLTWQLQWSEFLNYKFNFLQKCFFLKGVEPIAKFIGYLSRDLYGC